MSKNLGNMLSGLGKGLVGGLSSMGEKGFGGNPLLGGLFGGGGGDDEEAIAPTNPGQAMFGMGGDAPTKKPSFMSKFGSNLSDMLFAKAMNGFMGHM